MKKFLAVLLAVCLLFALSTTVLANETDVAVLSSKSNSGEHSYNHRVVGRAYNDAPGGSVAITVVSNVDTTSGIMYYWSGNNCYAANTYSSFNYETEIYNPEVCSYSCELNSQGVTQDGTTTKYYASDLTQEDVLLPTDHWGEMYSRYYDGTEWLISFPINVKSTYAFTWSSNVVPSVAAFSTTFTLTAP